MRAKDFEVTEYTLTKSLKLFWRMYMNLNAISCEDHKDQSYSIRIIDCNDFNQIIACLKVVVAEIEDREIFIPPSNEYIKAIIAGYGEMAGVFTEDTLVGFASVVFPRKGKNNLGHLLKLDIEKLVSVVQLEHICILNEHRARGLAGKLINFLLARLNTQYTILLSTISPHNIPSLSVAFKRHQRIVALIDIYGTTRYLMYQNLMQNFSSSNNPALEIKASNLTQIAHMLSNGYVGVSFSIDKSSILFIGDRKNEKVPD